MNAQEIFDKVATHLFAQGTRCYDEEELACAYFGPNGMKCAVGALIPEPDYRGEIEGENAADALAILAPHSQVCADLREHEALLEELQCAHDASVNWSSTEFMRLALHKVANSANLHPFIVDTLSFKDR